MVPIRLMRIEQTHDIGVADQWLIPCHVVVRAIEKDTDPDLLHAVGGARATVCGRGPLRKLSRRGLPSRTREGAWVRRTVLVASGGVVPPVARIRDRERPVAFQPRCGSSSTIGELRVLPQQDLRAVSFDVAFSHVSRRGLEVPAPLAVRAGIELDLVPTSSETHDHTLPQQRV